MSGPTPPPLAIDVEGLLRCLHLAYMRRAAREVLATARASLERQRQAFLADPGTNTPVWRAKRPSSPTRTDLF